ncbi:putative family 28 glycosyltransferase [Hamiltosporidium tvaerminnensis]|uniref:UDP-N-acetylglucosamine transferase subunit ALG13 n=1 Tax=Hamiltosporidium tvaerminnensis TaxID=1176355 RepID=A0A4Q9M3P0_9MICR|nr:putative family 28 glycosyltransferase [Hamiltosporidium tvaerminnensis]
MKLLVTVGSTSFDLLIKKIVENIHILQKKFTKIFIQTGETNEKFNKIENVTIINYKYPLPIDIYDVILTHGGTGTILESLFANKSTFVIINENLKHNHQSDFVKRMEAYIHVVSLQNVIEMLIQDNLVPKKKLQPSKELLF